jgi:hypothetical protein
VKTTSSNCTRGKLLADGSPADEDVQSFALHANPGRCGLLLGGEPFRRRLGVLLRPVGVDRGGRSVQMDEDGCLRPWVPARRNLARHEPVLPEMVDDARERDLRRL